MSPESKINLSAVREVIELLRRDGFEGMQPAIELLMNEAMRVERSEALGALPYEGTEERRGYAKIRPSLRALGSFTSPCRRHGE